MSDAWVLWWCMMVLFLFLGIIGLVVYLIEPMYIVFYQGQWYRVRGRYDPLSPIIHLDFYGVDVPVWASQCYVRRVG